MSKKQAINIIFDAPPGNKSGRFIEVETDNGQSINAGKWIERPDGLWSLRITELPDKDINIKQIKQKVDMMAYENMAFKLLGLI